MRVLLAFTTLRVAYYKITKGLSVNN